MDSFLLIFSALQHEKINDEKNRKHARISPNINILNLNFDYFDLFVLISI